MRSRWILGPVVAVLLYVGVLTARFVDTYAGSPDAAKDCEPLPGAPGGEAVLPDPPPPPPSTVVQTGGTVNDASCLNRTRVHGVARPRDVADLRELLTYAADAGVPISVAGARHSMGGQAFAAGALVVDMTAFDRMTIDEDRQTLTVGSGATWHQVLDHLHDRGLSVASMQGVDILTVGGSVAVNAHGTDHRSGSIASTVRALTVMLADGRVVRADRRNEGELFRAVVGGYGLLGIILDVELDLVANAMYDFDQRVIRTRHFPAVYAQQVAADPQIKLAYAHLSTDPASLLREAILYTYAERGGHDGPVPELGSVGWTRTGRFVLNMAKTGSVGQWLKWSAQKHVLPRFRPCQVQRSDALGESEACWVSRNQALFTSLDVLKNKIPDDTDILQEYFLPPDQLVGFLEHAEAVLAGSDAVLVNASIRAVAADDILLSYAPSDRFAVVLYVNQKTTAAGDAAMAELTGALIDAALERGGAFYLPYQLRYTPEQLAAAYPRAEAFFELKRSWDPDERFTSTFYERYGPSGG